MNHLPAILCLIGSLALFTDAHAVVQPSGSSRILTLAVIAQLPDGRGSVGLVDSRGAMTILYQDEHTRPAGVAGGHDAGGVQAAEHDPVRAA